MSMTTSADRQTPAAPAAHPPRRFRRRWALALTTLVGVLFTGMTATTIALWATDATYDQTNPVVDLAFFALGGILLTGGLASQVRRAPTIAGLQQAIVALVSLAVAGLLGARIEPAVGPLLILTAVVPLIVLHPDRGELLARGAGTSRPLMLLTVVATGPAAVYAADMLARAREAGASCFLGQCVEGDRYAEAAALVIAVALTALLAAARTPGWRLPVVCAGLGAVVLGAASLVFAGEVGALSAPWALAAIGWGVAFGVTATRGR